MTDIQRTELNRKAAALRSIAARRPDLAAELIARADRLAAIADGIPIGARYGMGRPGAAHYQAGRP